MINQLILSLVALLVTCSFISALAGKTALDEYVWREDENYGWKELEQYQFRGDKFGFTVSQLYDWYTNIILIPS
jgi:hypothetical protein